VKNTINPKMLITYVNSLTTNFDVINKKFSVQIYT